MEGGGIELLAVPSVEVICSDGHFAAYGYEELSGSLDGSFPLHCQSHMACLRHLRNTLKMT